MKTKKHGRKDLSRRDFIKTTAVGVGATALAGLGSEEAKALEYLPENWDKEADVVIVGYGGAGAVAAITAHDAGAKVLIVEKQQYAMKMYPGCYNTFGGPKRSAKGQVVDTFDRPIPRLYSAGELGSILGFLYAGGGWNLCEIVVSGQLAGKYAAAEASWAQDARLPHG